MSEMRRGPGRPRKSAADLKNAPVHIVFTKDQLAFVARAADTLGLPIATWARGVLLEQASMLLHDPARGNPGFRRIRTGRYRRASR